MSGQHKRYEIDGLYVQFDFSDIKRIVAHSLKKSKNEIGGIITGKYVEERKYAVINTFHLPTKDSIRKPYNFIRGKSGINNLLKRLWKKEEYYLGEWHLHPYASPSASNTDMEQLLSIARKTDYKCPEPIMFIVGSDQVVFNINIYIVTDGTIKQMKEVPVY